jgi:RimJ/RimL family protein N-acetyltransferase
MVEELHYDEWDKVSQLFAPHTLAKSLIFPCMKKGLGSIIVDNPDSPSVAMYSTPLMVFVAGDANSPTAKEMVMSVQPYVLFMTYDKNWKILLEREWGDKLVTDVRTHMDHSTLDIHHLRELKSGLKQEYALKKLDLAAAVQIKNDYSIPIRLYFGSIKSLVEKGIGFCVMQGDKVASIAYTSFPFIDEFEIQVFTEESLEYRRKGLATIASAALLVYALERGLTPHWDAANENSIKLALKLGYSNPKTWEAYYRKE